MSDEGHIKETRIAKGAQRPSNIVDFVLEKSIFSNIFEKDIQRVYIYKKAERLAKAIHLITPAFSGAPSLRNKLDMIAVGLVDAAILAPGTAKEAFSRELLALSSVLSIARSGGLLSPMNANLIASEAHLLLAEIAGYQEPRLFLDDSPTLAMLSKQVGRPLELEKKAAATPKVEDKGHMLVIKDSKRADTILSVIKDKGTVDIKAISTVLRDVSEKTIQRELKRLVAEGVLEKHGSRRWTAYSLAGAGL